jgi:hypothetical protein
MESIYTIGTFVELIEKIVMPSLIMRVDEELMTIKLEAWPFCIDLLEDHEKSFFGKRASHWVYHLYDNNLRMFTHLTEELSTLVEDGDNSELAEFENLPVDINLDPVDFEKFFEYTDMTAIQQLCSHFVAFIETGEDDPRKKEAYSELLEKIFSVSRN